MNNLLTLDEVAERTGLTLRTLHTYKWAGLLPPPRRVIGRSPLYAAADIALFNRVHAGCPARRKSVRLAKKRGRAK